VPDIGLAGIGVAHFGVDLVDGEHPFDAARAAFRCRSQARISDSRRWRVPIRRSRHWPRSTPISISTMFRQCQRLSRARRVLQGGTKRGAGTEQFHIEAVRLVQKL
jgi:hypothetical protein